MIKEFICKGCEDKCVVSLDWDEENMEINGNRCEEAFSYAKEARYDNKDIFTTLVRIKGAKCNVVPVKSSKPMDKKLWVECSKALSMLHVGAPIKIGDVVCHNLLNTGVDILCTKNADKM
ncbi:hypothetical protein CLLI_26660 [Clostridium liquoris]|jgi:CxxC motif-containing protein|uniref:DUF1667 domain-containing protein n=1 Tax=Clostridium liquoris TaxID=1289519 RepID=A0A2T0B090_9CLOT|nr:DUF1667 domain-containing protein [Clostridium liquoris]PRR76932.1 hypothetical protein CLLI_26660 [Clostridium liquoris]